MGEDFVNHVLPGGLSGGDNRQSLQSFPQIGGGARRLILHRARISSPVKKGGIMPQAIG
jgi:hypothetical protein